MILEHEQWCFGYDQILKDCRPTEEDGGKTVLLLCNADVDAMSSARILSYMLRSDGVHYQLLPCHNYTELKERLQSMQDQLQQEIRAVVLLNFGASYNLARLYEQNLLQAPTKTYVLDCRRPIHLANVYARSSVVVFLDSTQKLQDMPSDGDNLSGSESSSSESDSDSDSDSDDSDDDSDSAHNNDSEDEDEEEANFEDVVGESNQQTKPQQTIDTSYDAEDEDDPDADHQDDDNDENKDPSIREAKRQKTDSKDTNDNSNPQEQDNDVLPQSQQSRLQPSELHRLRKARLRKYYNEGSFYGSPCSYISYQLAAQNRYGEQGDLLWLACVGVTDAYLHSRLDLIGYAQLAKDLSNSINKMYPSSFFDRALNTVYAEDLNSASSSSSSRTSNTTQTKIALSEHGRILSEKDFRFFLLRHSSLLDSMQYSQYVCTKLQLYTKKGEQQLLELLAKMGYPLDECKQPFCFMRPSLRRRLKQKLGTHAKVNAFMKNY